MPATPPVAEAAIRDGARSAADPDANPNGANPDMTDIAVDATGDGAIAASLAGSGTDGHLSFRSPEILSVLREDRAFADGDGGGGGTDGALWLMPVNRDLRTGRLIPIQALFGEPSDNGTAYGIVARRLGDAVAGQVWGGDPGPWAAAIEQAIRPDPMYLSTFTFVPSTVPDRIGGIAWHFEPDLVAPSARGVVSVVIPQAALRDLVTPEWRALFAGEPAGPRLVSTADDPHRSVLALN